jgi:hypothetical protein
VTPDTSTNDGSVNVRQLLSCNAEVQGNIGELKGFLGDNKATYTTYHPSFDAVFDSADLIHYHTCDYRRQKELELLSNKEFNEFTESYPAYYKEPFHMTSFFYLDLRTDMLYWR